MTDDASRKAFEAYRDARIKAGDVATDWSLTWQAAVAWSAARHQARIAELEAATRSGLALAVLALAFLGRDRGTTRMDSTLDGLQSLAKSHDALARAALSARDGEGEGND